MFLSRESERSMTACLKPPVVLVLQKMMYFDFSFFLYLCLTFIEKRGKMKIHAAVLTVLDKYMQVGKTIVREKNLFLTKSCDERM